MTIWMPLASPGEKRLPISIARQNHFSRFNRERDVYGSYFAANAKFALNAVCSAKNTV